MPLDWADVPAAVDDWAELCRGPARQAKAACCGLYAGVPVGIYYLPEEKQAALHAPYAAGSLLDVCRDALHDAGLSTRLRLLGEAELGETPAIKLAEAADPALRRPLEWANFFPGQYPWGQANDASPFASLLTSSLIGAGLGWAGGKGLSMLAPKGFGDNLARSGLLAGAALGGGLGAVPGLTNWVNRRDFNAAEPFGPDTPEPTLAPWLTTGVIDPDKSAFEDQRRAGFLPPAGGMTSDVHVDSLGRTLWEAQVNPADASAILSTMAAAQSLPSPRADPDWVSTDQLGGLALRAGQDYIKGVLVGNAVNMVVGTPFSAPAFGMASMAAGVIRVVLPKLFGG